MDVSVFCFYKIFFFFYKKTYKSYNTPSLTEWQYPLSISTTKGNDGDDKCFPWNLFYSKQITVVKGQLAWNAENP